LCYPIVHPFSSGSRKDLRASSLPTVTPLGPGGPEEALTQGIPLSLSPGPLLLLPVRQVCTVYPAVCYRRMRYTQECTGVYIPGYGRAVHTQGGQVASSLHTHHGMPPSLSPEHASLSPSLFGRNRLKPGLNLSGMSGM